MRAPSNNSLCPSIATQMYMSLKYMFGWGAAQSQKHQQWQTPPLNATIPNRLCEREYKHLDRYHRHRMSSLLKHRLPRCCHNRCDLGCASACAKGLTLGSHGRAHVPHFADETLLRLAGVACLPLLVCLNLAYFTYLGLLTWLFCAGLVSPAYFSRMLSTLSIS